MKTKTIKERPWLFFGFLSVLAGLLFFLHWKQLHVPNDHYTTPYFSDLYFHFKVSLHPTQDCYTLLTPIVWIPYILTGSEEFAAAFFSLCLTGSTVVSVLLVRSGKTVYALWVNFPADLPGRLESIAQDMARFHDSLWP